MLGAPLLLRTVAAAGTHSHSRTILRQPKAPRIGECSFRTNEYG